MNLLLAGTILAKMGQFSNFAKLKAAKKQIAWYGDRDYSLNLQLAMCAEEHHACKCE